MADEVMSQMPEYVPLSAMNDAKTSIVADLFGGTVAAVGDFAASTYNSVVPQSMEVNERDLIARLGDNALRVYDEHPDAVHTASFIGGMLVPAGLALKGTNALRAGMKGVNWFSEAGKIDQMGKVNTLIQEGKMLSEEYNVATRALYLRSAANTLVDNAAAELAIIGTMNAHPLMEDYMKDPVHSFGVSMMLGTALVTPFTHIGTRADIRGLGQAAYGEATAKVLEGYKPISYTEDLSVQVAQHQKNIDNWENALTINTTTNEYNKLTTDMISSFVRSSRAAQVETFEKMASPEIAKLPTELRDNLISRIASEPERFAGINSISFASAKDETNFLKTTYEKLFSSTQTGKGIPLTKQAVKDGKLVTVKDDMIYSPTFDAFMRRSDLKGYGVAADIINDEKELTKGMTNSWYRVPNYEADLEKLGESAAYIDTDYLRKLKAVDEMPMTELSKVVVSPDDGPMLNAVLARMNKLATEGQDVSSLKVTLTKSEPNWDKIQESLFQNEIQRVSSGGSGVKASYMQDLQRGVEAQWNQFDLFSNKISSAAKSLLRDWKAGSGMTTMRNALDDAFRPSQYARHGVPQEHIDAVKEMYNSAASTSLRQALMQVADSEGYVYLYRGLRKEAFSSATLESFTTNAQKAAEFGTPKLYKVKVQDVFGGIRDIPGNAGYERSTEVLVMSHTREGMDKLPIAQLVDAIPEEFSSLSKYGVDEKTLKAFDKTNLKNLVANSYDDFIQSNPFKEGMDKAAWNTEAEAYIKAATDDYLKTVNDFNAAKNVNTATVNNEAGFMDLHAALLKQKEEDIKMMTSMGIPPEVIRTRTNTPLDTVKAVQLGAKLDELPSRLYSSASEIGQHLGIEKKSLVVGTTANKIPVAQMRSQIHTSMMDEADTMLKQMFLSASPSVVLRDMAEYLFSKNNQVRMKLLKDSLMKVNPATAGSRFWQSADAYMRDMGDAGLIMTEMGKDSSHLYNKYTNQIVKPISDAFATITKDAAGIVEFNTARELNASLKGYREFRAGQFFVQDELNPWKILPSGEKIRNMVPAKWKGKEFTITTPSVLNAFERMQEAGRELYNMNSTYRNIIGQTALNDNGFWMPAFNPRNKYITYVVDHVDGTTRLLYGHTPQELVSAENAYAATMSNRTPGSWDFVRKGADQALYNKIEGRHDPMFMSVADITALHGGSSTAAIVPTNTNVFSELANGYEHYIHRSVSNHLELQYSDVIGHLDSLSAQAKSLTENQPVSRIQKALNVIDDAGLSAKNTLLGRNNLKEYVGWQDAQNGIQTTTEMILQKINSVMDPILNPAKGLLGRGKSLSDKEWEKLVDDMEARGIPNPFKDLDDAVAKERFHVERISQAPNMTARVVALSNNLAATTLLKVMELGQPLVNMLSLPILTSAAVQRQFTPEFMGAALKPGFQLSTTRAMYDGVRYLSHPDYAKYKAMASDLGVLTPVVSEVSELLQMTRSFNPGAMQKVENALNSKLVEMLSKPSMWSEQAVREFSFATGVSLAKKAYPGLGDTGVMTFARNFVDTAVGNYNPAQRPTVFQGTIGTAMGLFQTYMVTLMQQVYRKAELRDYKGLAKMALTQSSIFGVKSLPGFNQVSEQIGEHFSDGNIDLTTGMYRAVPEGLADLTLYGLPSNLGPAIYTRGDIQPRIPNIIGGVQNLAAVNILGQAVEAASNLGKAATQMGDEGGAKAFAEALSVQSISRPLARLSELATGHSVTKKGNEIAGPEEIYSAQGILARVFATRGLREAKAREAQYLNSMYDSLDREQRSEALKVLKNHIRSDTLTPEIIETVNEKYMRTGSAKGWRSAVNTALHDTDSPGVSAVRNHLHPGSALNLMIDDLD